MSREIKINPNSAIQIGQLYTLSSTVYILARSFYQGNAYAQLVALDSGVNWAQAVLVKHETAITQDEWEKITSGKNFALFSGGEVTISEIGEQQ